MLLTIHNLPSHMQYANVRLLIQSQCDIKADDMILDNLVNEGRLKKVTVGLVGEKQAEILKRKINGMLMGGQQLCVKDQGEKQAGDEKRNRSNAYQTNNSPSQQSQTQQSQQGYPTNFIQYQRNYGLGNQQYMSQEQMMQMQMQMMIMNTPMMGTGGVGYMPLQNPHMDYSGQMQSAIAPQFAYNQQEQNVESAKTNDRSASTTKNWGQDANDDYVDRYQNKGDGDRGDSRSFDRDDEYNNRYPDDQYAFKNNDRAMNERSKSWGRDENSRYNEKSYQNYSSNQANRPHWDTDRERQQRSYYQSGRNSRSRSRSPYYYEDRERAVSRDKYQDTGRPDSSYQRKDSAHTAVASTSRQYGGDDNYNSQDFNSVDMYEPSSDRGNQSGNRRDQPDNPLPQSRYRWDKRDKPRNPSPQSGNRWDKPDNPLPQSRDVQPQGDRWDKPNIPSPQSRSAQPQGDRWDKPYNQSPQSRGAQPQGDRWDKPNNPSLQSRGAQPQGNRWDKPYNQSPQGRGAQPQRDRWDKPYNQSPQGKGAQPQGDRWDKPYNQSPQGRGAQPQGDRWGKSSTSQPREPQKPAPPKRNSSQPIFWKDHSPSSFKGNMQPQMPKPLPPPPKQNTAPHKSFKSKETLPKNNRNNRKSPFITPNIRYALNKIYKTRNTAAAAIADVMCKALPPDALPRHRKRIRNSIKKSVYVRIELILKDDTSRCPSVLPIIHSYREKFPTSTDRQMLKICYEQITKTPLPPAPETVPTSPDQSGAAFTSVEETTKVEPVEDEVSFKPNEAIVRVVPDEPKNVEADVTVDKQIKLETSVVQNIPKQVTPAKPAVPQIVGRLPKYPNGDKQAYKDNKKLAANEFEIEGYAVDPVLLNALNYEIAPIKGIFQSELKRPGSGEERRICKIILRQAQKFGKCLRTHVIKRVLDIPTNLIVRVFMHGKVPPKSEVENLLRQYGVISLKKSVRQGPLYYIAECANYELYDQLLKIGSFSQGTATTLVIKPFHITGLKKKPLRQKTMAEGKEKQ